jgi:hypothetical protein
MSSTGVAATTGGGDGVGKDAMASIVGASIGDGDASCIIINKELIEDCAGWSSGKEEIAAMTISSYGIGEDVPMVTRDGSVSCSIAGVASMARTSNVDGPRSYLKVA